MRKMICKHPSDFGTILLQLCSHMFYLIIMDVLWEEFALSIVSGPQSKSYYQQQFSGEKKNYYAPNYYK